MLKWNILWKENILKKLSEKYFPFLGENKIPIIFQHPIPCLKSKLDSL